MEGKAAIVSALADSGSVLYALPTAGGKTYVFGMVAEMFLKRRERVCVVVHKTVLTNQTIESIADTCGVRADKIGRLVDGKWTNPDADLLVCMAQSLSSQIKSGRLDQERIGLVILDEAHRSVSPTFMTIVEHFKAEGAKILGVTATPERLDGKPMGNVFSTMVRGPSFGDLTKAGHIARPIYYAPSKDVLPHLKGVQKSGGDHAIAALSDRCIKVVGKLVEQWELRRPKKGGTLIFAVDIKHAERIAKEFKENGHASVEVATSKNPEDVDAIFGRLKSGKTKVVINVMIAVEGFDAPDISCLVIARPTLSRALYIQMVGRALRVRSKRARPVILDHTTNTSIFGKAERYHAPELDEVSERPGYESKTVERACPKCGRLTLAAGESCEECGYTFKASDKREVVNVHGELVELTDEDGEETKSHPCMCGCGKMSPAWAYVPSHVKRRNGLPWTCKSMARRFWGARKAGYAGTIADLARIPYTNGRAVCAMCDVTFDTKRHTAVMCRSCSHVSVNHAVKYPGMGHCIRDYVKNRLFLKGSFIGVQFNAWYKRRKPDSRGIPTCEADDTTCRAVDMSAAIEAVRQGIPLRDASAREGNAAGAELVQKLEPLDLSDDEELSVASRPSRRRMKGCANEAAE